MSGSGDRVGLVGSDWVWFGSVATVTFSSLAVTFYFILSAEFAHYLITTTKFEFIIFHAVGNVLSIILAVNPSGTYNFVQACDSDFSSIAHESSTKVISS